MRYKVNGIELNLHAGLIIKNGNTQYFQSKTLGVLTYLIENREHSVSNSTLLNAFFSNVIVGEASLNESSLDNSIEEVIALLGDNVIKSDPDVGYQWVGELSKLSGSKLSAPHLSTLDIIKRLVGIIIVSLLVIWVTKNVIIGTSTDETAIDTKSIITPKVTSN